MKSSALALITAAALMFGASSVSFAQDAAAPATETTTNEECPALTADDAETAASLVDENDTDTEGTSGGSGTDDAASSESTDTEGNTDNDDSNGTVAGIECPAADATTTTTTTTN